MKSFLNILVLFGIAYGILCLLMYLCQKKMIFFPDKKITLTPADIGLKYQDFYLTASNGETIHGWNIPHKDSRYYVLFFHGNGGNISHRLDTLMIMEKLKLSLVIFDYQGYGKSSGTPSEKNTYDDAETIWKYAVNKLNIKPGNIILWGRSLGGAVAAYLAEKENPKALIMESTFSSIPDLASHLYPVFPARFLCTQKFDSYSRITGISCPKLFIHSIQDDIIPFKLGKKLFLQASPPKTFVEINGDHNSGFIESENQYSDPIRNFLKNI